MSHSRVLVGIEIAVVFLCCFVQPQARATMRSSYGPLLLNAIEKKL